MIGSISAVIRSRFKYVVDGTLTIPVNMGGLR
jgi:hypothetical protein